MIRFCCWQRRLPLTSCIRWKATSTSSRVEDKAVKPFSAIPSPPGSLPFVGHSRLLKDVTSFTKFAAKHSRELGPIFKLNMMGQSVVFIADPHAVEKVYRHEGKYPVRSLRDENMNSIVKKEVDVISFAFQTGEGWRVSRSKFGKHLLPANVYGYCPGFNKVSKRFIRNVYEMQNNDGIVDDIRDLILYWSLEVSSYFVFGADLDSRNDENGEAKELKDAFGGFIDSIFDLQFSLPLYKVFPTAAYKKFVKSLREVHKIGRKYADRYISDIKARAAVNEKIYGMSLLEQWLIEGKMSPDEAVVNAVEFFAAGIDTTAHTTAFTLYELAKHPEVQEKAYKHLMDNKEEADEVDGNSLQKLTYLGHILKETQRFYSVSNFTSRILLDKDIELLGYHIPAKTQLLGVMEAMGQDPKLFKDPQKFNPDRWTTDDIHPFIVLPFGFGPKSCWGRRFAEVDIRVLISQLVQQFKMESKYPGDRLPYDGMTLSRPSVPIKIKFIPRN